MATLASAALRFEAEPSAPPARDRNAAFDGVATLAPVADERAVYQPSRRSGPVAFVASAGVMLAVAAVLATLNIAAQEKATPHLTVVAMKELDVTPPPPAAPPPPKQLEEPVAQPPVFVPTPKIALPVPGPTQVALDIPPPALPPVTAPPRAAVAAPADAGAPAPAAASPIEGGDLSSQLLSAKPPAYPVDARRRKEQGVVKLMVLVGPDGRVSDIKVANSSGSARLDDAALSAVKRWRWNPQSKNGAPVAVRGYVTIPFVLTA